MIIKGISIVGEIDKPNKVLIDDITSDNLFQGFQHNLMLQQNEGTFFKKNEDGIEKILIIGLSRIEYGIINLNQKNFDLSEIANIFNKTKEKRNTIFNGQSFFRTIGIIANLSFTLGKEELLKIKNGFNGGMSDQELISYYLFVNFKKGDFNYNIQFILQEDNLEITLDINNRFSKNDKNDVLPLLSELDKNLKLGDMEFINTLGIK